MKHAGQTILLRYLVKIKNDVRLALASFRPGRRPSFDVSCAEEEQEPMREPETGDDPDQLMEMVQKLKKVSNVLSKIIEARTISAKCPSNRLSIKDTNDETKEEGPREAMHRFFISSNFSLLVYLMPFIPFPLKSAFCPT